MTCNAIHVGGHHYKYRQPDKLQAATPYYDYKQGFNLERLGEPNIEPTSRFDVQYMASPRAKRIGSGDLMRGSGRGWPQ